MRRVTSYLFMIRMSRVLPRALFLASRPSRRAWSRHVESVRRLRDDSVHVIGDRDADPDLRNAEVNLTVTARRCGDMFEKSNAPVSFTILLDGSARWRWRKDGFGARDRGADRLPSATICAVRSRESSGEAAPFTENPATSRALCQVKPYASKMAFFDALATMPGAQQARA